jgi:hypothetical protein
MSKKATKQKASPAKRSKIMDALGDLAIRVGREVSDVVSEPLSGLAADVAASVRKRAGDTVQEGVTKGLKATRQIVVPAIRVMARLPNAVDYAARLLAEDQGIDWTIAPETIKEDLRAAVIGVIRGLERYLMEDQ